MYACPPPLRDAILGGRCIAFVGAGFSSPAAPTWTALLRQLGGEVREGASAFELEMLGQQLRAENPHDWEARVQTALAQATRRDAIPSVQRRVRLLGQIPFKAILTTNFDPFLPGDAADAASYWDILRELTPPGWQLGDQLERRRATPIVKLHGEANGDPARNPLVFARSEYRQRVYGDGQYANFIRAVFAQYTVLFLGVSFTDAYLNELRSEVLSMFVPAAPTRTPWGYAVYITNASAGGAPPPASLRAVLRAEEQLELLPVEDYGSLDRWLDAIARATSIEGRLGALLRGKRILWVDANPLNNRRGVDALRAEGVDVIQLLEVEDIDHHALDDVELILTSFGYDRAGPPRAVRLLERLPRERPPVIVFAESTYREQNRRTCLRHGAWEFASGWRELYALIERLLARGDTGATQAG